jgi:hypothetical protein
VPSDDDDAEPDPSEESAEHDVRAANTTAATTATTAVDDVLRIRVAMESRLPGKNECAVVGMTGHSVLGTGLDLQMVTAARVRCAASAMYLALVSLLGQAERAGQALERLAGSCRACRRRVAGRRGAAVTVKVAERADHATGGVVGPCCSRGAAVGGHLVCRCHQACGTARSCARAPCGSPGGAAPARAAGGSECRENPQGSRRSGVRGQPQVRDRHLVACQLGETTTGVRL